MTSAYVMCTESSHDHIRMCSLPRQHLVSLRTHLTALRLLSLPEDTTSVSSTPSPSIDTFTQHHWHLLYLAFERATCVAESRRASDVWMEATSEAEDGMQQHVMRWSQVQRQMHIITTLVQSKSDVPCVLHVKLRTMWYMRSIHVSVLISFLC